MGVKEMLLFLIFILIQEIRFVLLKERVSNLEKTVKWYIIKGGFK